MASTSFPWKVNSLVSTGGQLGPTGRANLQGYYLWGWDGTGANPGNDGPGNALFFVPHIGAPAYTPAEWMGAVMVPGAAEADRILKQLYERGELFGRPGTEFAGAKLTGGAYGTLSTDSTGGPVAPTGGQTRAGTTVGQQTAQQSQQSNSYGGGSAMNGGGLNISVFESFHENTKRILYGQFILRISGNYTPAAPATGSVLKILGTAIGAASGEATAAALDDVLAYQQAEQEYKEAWFDYQRICNLLDSQLSMMRAWATGDQMAVQMAMMNQQTAALTGSYGL